MALFTDQAVITADDLLEFEASLAQISSSHGINVETKINLAKSAISDRVMLWLLNAGASDPQWATRRALGMSTVIVTAALARWLCFESLARFFAEAYNLQLNSRYQGKWNEYKQEAEKAGDLFFLTGIGLVGAPLARPSKPLASVQAGNAPAQTIYIQTVWVNGKAEESAASATNSVVLAANSSVVVAMAEGAVRAPASAIGWNVYAGQEPGQLTKQNIFPLQIGSTWELPSFGLQVGDNPSGGQEATVFVALTRRIKRG